MCGCDCCIGSNPTCFDPEAMEASGTYHGWACRCDCGGCITRLISGAMAHAAVRTMAEYDEGKRKFAALQASAAEPGTPIPGEATASSVAPAGEDHGAQPPLPECEATDCGCADEEDCGDSCRHTCICDRLRACEERKMREWFHHPETPGLIALAYASGFSDHKTKAVEAVEALPFLTLSPHDGDLAREQAIEAIRDVTP